jgi:formylglycine-generating enzyme required for sulfatase activity
LPATPPPSLAAAPPLPDPHPQRAEYDAALRALRDALLAQAKPEAIAGQVLAVEQAIQKLPLADQKETRILTLLKGIAEFRSAPPELSPVDLGPASPAAAAARLIRWKVSIDPQSGTITYSAPAPRQIGTDELLIVFKRIEATPSTPAFYLSTTEISLGLFADVISASAKWADVAPLLWKYTSRNGDPRAGPRAWEWSSTGRGGLGIRRTLVWLAGDGDHYPPRLSSAQSRVVLGDADGRFARELNPSKRQPMQYVSADAAIYFAHLLGARLPTSAELQTALASAEERDANLRDLTWRHQQQWSRAASRPAERTQDWGAFVAPGEADSNDVWTHRQLHLGDDDRPYHDGALWFRDVANNDLQNFAQLIGNVAEYALDGDQLYVVGASALSPPSRSLNKAILVPGGRPAAKGWSDVGFRIALSIPPSPREQLRLAIDGAPLLATAAE